MRRVAHARRRRARATPAASAARHRGEDQRAVRQRLVARNAQPPAQRLGHRRRWPRRPASSGSSFGEVVPQRPRPFEVHVVERAAVVVAVEVHEHPDAASHPVRDVELARAQSSGTSPRPSARAAVAGNSLWRSSVAVKMMLTMSSCAMPLRSSIVRTSAWVRSVMPVPRILVARRRAPQRKQLHGRGGYRRGLRDPFSTCPCTARRVQRRAPRAAVSGRHSPGPSLASCNGPMRVRAKRPHRVTHGLAHAAHLAVAALVDHDLDQRAFACSSTAHRQRAGAVGPSSSSTPLRNARERGSTGVAVHLGHVRLVDAVARVREQLGELAVVREHEQAHWWRRRAGRRGTRAARPARAPRPWAGLADRRPW